MSWIGGTRYVQWWPKRKLVKSWKRGRCSSPRTCRGCSPGWRRRTLTGVTARPFLSQLSVRESWSRSWWSENFNRRGQISQLLRPAAADAGCNFWTRIWNFCRFVGLCLYIFVCTGMFPAVKAFAGNRCSSWRGNAIFLIQASPQLITFCFHCKLLTGIFFSNSPVAAFQIYWGWSIFADFYSAWKSPFCFPMKITHRLIILRGNHRFDQFSPEKYFLSFGRKIFSDEISGVAEGRMDFHKSATMLQQITVGRI